MKIKITKSSGELWYKDHIGEEHTVTGWHSELGYALFTETGDEGETVLKHVSKDHCDEILPEYPGPPFSLMTQRKLEELLPTKIFIENRGVFKFKSDYSGSGWEFGYFGEEDGVPLLSYVTRNINLTHLLLVELACTIKYKYRVHF